MYATLHGRKGLQKYIFIYRKDKLLVEIEKTGYLEEKGAERKGGWDWAARTGKK